MIAVAIAAIFLSLPSEAVKAYLSIGSILAVIILVPAGLAPSGHRVRAGFWATALHPLVLLVWLTSWRSFGDRSPLNRSDKSWTNAVLLTWPYLMAFLSLYYLPVFAMLGCCLGWNVPRRRITKALLVFLIAWSMTWAILAWDPFELSGWFFD